MKMKEQAQVYTIQINAHKIYVEKHNMEKTQLEGEVNALLSLL